MNKNIYTFQGIRFIPGYNDFDCDDVNIEATSEQEAWQILNKEYKYWKSVGLTHINNKPIN